MVNKALFKSFRGDSARTDCINEAGGKAYGFDAEAALAQLVVTGTMTTTFYASGAQRIERVPQHR